MADPVSVGALVAASIEATVALVQAVANSLTSARSVIIEVDNNTNLTLFKQEDHHESGGFAELPKLQIPPNTAEVFGSQSKGGGVLVGTVGSVTYTADGLTMLVGWNNAQFGDNTTNIGPNNSGLGGPNANRFVALHQTGVGNQQAHMRFMLFPHPPYSLREVFKDKGDVSQGIRRLLQPGNPSIRNQLPNTTAFDVT